MLEIRLLGDVTVVLDGTPVTEFESASTKALLARLAYRPGHPVRRAELAEMLWPERPAGHALANLRHSLSVLRGLLHDRERDPPLLVATRESVMLAPGPDLWVDLARFERLARAPVDEPGVAQAWDGALALRRGAFLADLDLPLGEEWDAWLTACRAEVDRLTIDLLQRLGDLRERAGRVDDALALARAELAIDPWSEPAHTRAVRLTAAAGRVPEALTLAEAYRRTLGEEMGAEPGRTFQALVDEIRRTPRPRPGPEPLALPPRATRAAEPCVAREAELGWLHQNLDDAQTGAGRAVFVSGPAGSGKTVLLRAFAAAARERLPNLLVLRGTCNAHTGPGDPYLPYRRILGQLCGDLEWPWLHGDVTRAEAEELWGLAPTSIEALLDVGPYLLGTMIDAPSLAHRFSEGFPGHPLGDRLRAAVEEAAWRSRDPMRQQHPVLDQFVDVLARLARTRPLLLVVDDLHRADRGTLDLTGHLADRLADLPVLLVAALRPTRSSGGSAPLTAVVDEVRSRSRADCLLALSGSRRFVDAWLDTEPNGLDEAFREDLFHHTAGHALFTVEMVAALRDRGDLVRDAHGRWVAGDALDWTRLPPRVEATIATRIGLLPAEVRQDLEAACVQGDRFVAEVVASARGVDPDAVTARLATVTEPAHALVEYLGADRVGDSRVHRYRFRHTLVRQYLDDSLTDSGRVLLHERTAQALVDLHGGDLDAIATDLARHFDAAEDADEGARFHQRAGLRAVAMSATADAITHLRRAHELITRRPASDARDLAELEALAPLGACLQATFGYGAPETIDAYERLRALVASVGPSMPSAAALGGLVTVDGLRARYGAAIGAAQALLDMAERLGAPPMACVAHVQVGWLLLMTARLAEARQHLDAALEMYDPAWDPALTLATGIGARSTALGWRALLHSLLGHPGQAGLDSRAAVEVASSSGFPFPQVFALGVGGCAAAVHLGDGPAVLAAAGQLGSIAEREGFVWYQLAALLYRGLGLSMTGAPQEGLPMVEQAISSFAPLGTEAFTSWFRCNQAEHLVAAGALDRAADVIATVERQLVEGEEQVSALWLPVSKAALQRARGDDEAAEATLQAGLAAAAEAGAGGPLLRVATALARLLLDRGDRGAALAVLAPVVDALRDEPATTFVDEARALLDLAR